MESLKIPKPFKEFFLAIDLLYQLNIILFEIPIELMEFVFTYAKAKARKI